MEYTRSLAYINVNNLKDNVRNIFNYIRKKIFAVVKADAYGHDAEIVTKALEPLECVDMFCVATAHEGYLLRKAGTKKPILILGGILKEEIGAFNDFNLIPVVSDFNHLEIAKKLKNKTIHIKIDTGMRRLGFYPSDFEYLQDSMKNFRIEGVLSHFPSADTDRNYTLKQILEFRNILHTLNIKPKYIHIQNSAGVIYECSFCNAVRVGLAIYGEKPTDNYPLELKPVMSITSKVISIKSVKKGDKISYNGTFKAEKDMKVAVVAFGYADGLPRILSNKGHVIINNKKCKIVGSITMDMIIVDVSNLNKINIGDNVIIVGKSENQEITFSEIAKLSGTIPYEIMCGISKRVLRKEVK